MWQSTLVHQNGTVSQRLGEKFVRITNRDFDSAWQKRKSISITVQTQKKKFVGRVIIPLESVAEKPTQDAWFPLGNKKGIKDPAISGDVHVGFTYNGPKLQLGSQLSSQQLDYPDTNKECEVIKTSDPSLMQIKLTHEEKMRIEKETSDKTRNRLLVGVRVFLLTIQKAASQEIPSKKVFNKDTGTTEEM